MVCQARHLLVFRQVITLGRSIHVLHTSICALQAVSCAYVSAWLTVWLKVARLLGCQGCRQVLMCGAFLLAYKPICWDWHTCTSTYLLFEQLWTVVLWLIHSMAKLVTVVGQHLDIQPTTVVIRATTWWETVFAHVKLQECGLGVYLPVNVGYYMFEFEFKLVSYMYPSFNSCGLWHSD